MSSREGLGQADAAPVLTRTDRRGRYALIAAAVGFVLAGAAGSYVLVAGRTGLGSMSMTQAIVTLIAIGVLIVGGLLLIVGLGYYVLAPGFQGKRAAWQDVGSHRLVLASTALIVVVANIGPLVLMPVLQARGLCSVPSFVTAALSIDIALIGLTYLRFIRPGVITVTDLGLRAPHLAYNVGFGLLLGVGVLVISATIQAALQALGVKQ